MQRHFSNRGEAVAEVAAAKIITHRISKPNSNPGQTRFFPERWPRRVLPSFSTVVSQTRKPRKTDKPKIALPEL